MKVDASNCSVGAPTKDSTAGGNDPESANVDRHPGDLPRASDSCPAGHGWQQGLHLVPPYLDPERGPEPDHPSPRRTAPGTTGPSGVAGLRVLDDISGGRTAHATLVSAAPGTDSSPTLDVSDIQALFALLRRIGVELARRSVNVLQEIDLRRAERHAEAVASNCLKPLEANHLHTTLCSSLLIPGASHVEAVTIILLLHQIADHFGDHSCRLGTRLGELGKSDDSAQCLVAAFRTGDPDIAARATGEYFDGREQLALRVATHRENLRSEFMHMT